MRLQEDFGSWFVEGEGYKDVLRYASIPIVAALIGYGTNVLAIQMTFLPLEYIGWGEKFFHRWGFSCGWQGIIPSKAEKMARKAVRLITTKLIRVQDVFDQLEPAEIVKCVEPKLQHTVERVLHEVASTHCPDVWETLPLVVRSEVARAVCERSPPYIEAMMRELKGQIEEILDLEEFVVEKLTEDPELLGEIFKRCGEAEFRFIERSGLYFGFLLGLLQSLAWYGLTASCYPKEFFLPAAGALCGYVTNWIAMFLIFKPIEPIKCCCCFTIHGLFLRRQREVSKEFAALCAGRVLTARNCWERILYGPNREAFEKIVMAQIRRAVDEQAALVRPMLPLVAGGKTYVAAKEQAAGLFVEFFPAAVASTYEYSQRAMGTEDLLRTKMQELPSIEFEGVLHPVFEEDEWKLIAVGGLLGLWVGIFQAVFVFGALDFSHIF